MLVLFLWSASSDAEVRSQGIQIDRPQRKRVEAAIEGRPVYAPSVPIGPVDPNAARRAPSSTASPIPETDLNPAAETRHLLSRADKLSLEDAIARAMLKNRPFLIAKKTLESAELTYDTAVATAFLPQVTLSASTTVGQTAAALPNTAASAAGTVSNAGGFPRSNSVSLGLGSYTISNGFTNWLTYDLARLNWDRARQRFNETRRSLRFQVINGYYRLKTEEEKLDAARRSFEISEALLQLVRSGTRLGKTSERDVSSSQADFANAKNQLLQKEQAIKTERWGLNVVLGDPIDQQYTLINPLVYAPLKLTVDQSVEIYKKQSPTVLDQLVSLRSAEIALETAERARMPIPSVTFSGITLSYLPSYYSSTNQLGTDGATSGNLDVGVSVSLSLPIFGPTGFFGHRTVAAARIARDSTELGYHQTIASDYSGLYTTVNSILQVEERVKSVQDVFEQNAKVLDSLVADMTRNKVDRLQLRDAINNARQAEFDYKDMLRDHLSSKLGLAEKIGLDHLPGDPY